MPVAVADALESVATWAGRPVSHRMIKGGLSHQVALVETEDGDRWVLRVLNPKIAETGLGVPLPEEIANTVLASRTVGPKVLHELPDAIVLEYVDGVTLDAPAVRDRIPEIAAACRSLHSGPAFVSDFSIFHKLRELLARCRTHGLALPGPYDDVLPAVAAIEAAIEARPLPPAPCHNDLLAENFIAGRAGIRIVDYQLSGNNDPRFELGDIAAEADFTPDQVVRLTRAYFGDDAHVPYVRLYLIMSNLTWALWFVIHQGLVVEGALGFDYSAEAADKYAQAMRDLDAPSFGRLVDGRIPPSNQRR